MPSVEVVIFCHNHERFISRAVQSVFAQKTKAKLSVRILDDASTDRTSELLQELAKRAPIPVSLVVSATNQYQFGSGFKYRFANESQADFVAFLDGDDYWLSPSKIQDQLALMVPNRNVALCHSRFQGIDRAGRVTDFRPPDRFRRPVIDGNLLRYGNFVGTSTVLLRRSAMPDSMPDGFELLRGVDDYPLWAIISENRLIAYSDQTTTAYRLHGDNHFANQSQAIKDRQLLMALAYIASSVSEPNRTLWLQSIDTFLASRRIGVDVNARLGRIARKLFKNLYERTTASPRSAPAISGK